MREKRGGREREREGRREREEGRERELGRGRERETEDPKQAARCERRAQRRA